MSHLRSLFLTFAVESWERKSRASLLYHPSGISSSMSPRKFARLVYSQTHELFLSAPSGVIINRLGVLSLVPFCSQPYSASQPSAALLWMKNWGSECCKAARDFVVGAVCVSYGLRNREPVFLLILASPSMNNLLRQLALLARSLRDRYTRDLAVHFSLRRRTRSRCYQHRRCCAGHWFMHTLHIATSLGMEKCYQSSGRLRETWNRRIERSPIKIAKCRCRRKSKNGQASSTSRCRRRCCNILAENSKSNQTF